MDFAVESKYPLTIFKKYNLKCSWNTIQIGWDLGLLSADEVRKFALDFAAFHPELINKDIAELIFSKDSYEVKDFLKKIFGSFNLEFPLLNTPLWNNEWRKWRYCILNCMVDQIKNDEELLIKVEGLYADFNYPEDMKTFIYYMPVEKEVIGLTSKDARAELVKKLKAFLREEKNKIQLSCSGSDSI